MLKTLYVVVGDYREGESFGLGAFDDRADAEEFALAMAEEFLYERFLRLLNYCSNWTGREVECAQYCYKYTYEEDIGIMEVPYCGS